MNEVPPIFREVGHPSARKYRHLFDHDFTEHEKNWLCTQIIAGILTVDLCEEYYSVNISDVMLWLYRDKLGRNAGVDEIVDAVVDEVVDGVGVDTILESAN